jgi:hypothetical protein
LTTALTVPRDLLPEFQRFMLDFERVTTVWLDRGEETADEIALARDGLRAYLADPADPDECGGGRVDRLRDVFAFWRDLAGRMTRGGVAVQPVLPLELETRHWDREWNVHRGGR